MWTKRCFWYESSELWFSTKAECSSNLNRVVAMDRVNQGGLGGGWGIIGAGGLLSGKGWG